MRVSWKLLSTRDLYWIEYSLDKMWCRMIVGFLRKTCWNTCWVWINSKLSIWKLLSIKNKKKTTKTNRNESITFSALFPLDTIYLNVDNDRGFPLSNVICVFFEWWKVSNTLGDKFDKYFYGSKNPNNVNCTQLTVSYFRSIYVPHQI